MVTGALLAAGGMLHLSLLSRDGSYVTDILPGFIAVGVGTGLTYAPSFVAATSAVPAALTGTASGLINSSLQVGAAILLAVLVGVLSLAGTTDAVVGYRTALLTGATLPALAVALALRLRDPVESRVRPHSSARELGAG